VKELIGDKLWNKAVQKAREGKEQQTSAVMSNHQFAETFDYPSQVVQL
jgi:hypothetical protein